MSVPTNIFGAYKYDDLPKISVESVTEDQTAAYIASFLAGVSGFAAETLSLLTTTGTDVQAKFNSGGGGRLQRIGAATGLEATRTGGNWTIGFPIYAFADRSLFTAAYLERASLADLNRDVQDKAIKDYTTQIEEINRAILNNVNYTFNDDEWPGQRAGNVGVKALANADGGDGEVFVVGSSANSGRVALGSLNHYLPSGSNTLTEAAFTSARTALRNVGNDDQIVYLCSKATADAAEGLTNFVKRQDTNINNPNAIYSTVSSPRARGRIASGEVWEWPYWPDGYIFAFDRSKPKPVRIRLSDLTKYRGFQLVQDDKLPEIPARPLLNKMFRRVFGAGIYNRTNGVVVQVTNGSYTVPSAFI